MDKILEFFGIQEILEYKNMFDNKENKENIQKELEELSWAFMVEQDETTKEKEGIDGDNMSDKDSADDVDVEDLYNPNETNGSSHGVNDELKTWYAGSGDYDVNDMGRDRGIVFDENKLEQELVTEWHKAPRLKEGRLEKLAKGIGMAVLWPLRAIYFVVVNFFRGLLAIIWQVGKLIYKILRAALIFPWQLLVAFKYAFVYLFGDFSWLKQQKLKAVPVAVGPEPKMVKFVSWRDGGVWKKVGVFVALAVILVLPLQLYLSYNKVQDIKGQVLGASQLGLTHLYRAKTAGTGFNFDAAGEEFNLAEHEFVSAQDSVQQMGVVADSIGKFMPEVDTGKKLLKVAQLSAQIGRHLSSVAGVWGKFSGVARAGIATMNNEKPPAVSRSKINWAEIEGELELAVEKAYQTAGVLNEVNLEKTSFASYNPQLNGLKQEMPQLISWLENSRDIFQIMAHLMGTDEPRRWMLVFQNNSELRPTGGFMGSYAIVDIKDGQIQNIDVPGGGFYDLKGSLTTAVDAPYPFHLFSPIWQPWNANWFPDWPASAQKIMWFYDKSGGSTVDGVISFTPNVLEGLLALVGEIKMPEYGTEVNAENFVRMAQIEVELEYDKEENKPKKFIADLMPKILEKLADLDQDKLIKAWQVMSDALLQKHLLVYVSDKKLQKKIENFGWAGKINQTNHDYLAVIHTNVAGGKTDRVIKTKIEHKVEVFKDGVLIDTVKLAKTHKGKREDVFEGHVNTDYVRFYVPQGSKLVAAEGFDAMPEDREFKVAAVEADPHLEKFEKDLEIDASSGTRITQEFGKTVFANWMSVAPGETKTVMVKYLLPFRYEAAGVQAAAVQEDYSLWDLVKKYFLGEKKAAQKISKEHIYSLLIQKQAGTDGVEFESQIKTADNWKIKDYSSGDIKTENGVEFSGVLDTDKYYGVVLE